MSETASIFKPNDIIVELDEVKYRLYYDLNSFCEMEKVYESVDNVLQMLLGSNGPPKPTNVTYCGAAVNAEEILIDEVPLTTFLAKVNMGKIAKNSDTINLLWMGCMHDHCVYDEYGEIKGYSITKAKLAAGVTFKNLREVNAKILVAILQDLLPNTDESKNEPAPEEAKETVAAKPILTINK